MTDVKVASTKVRKLKVRPVSNLSFDPVSECERTYMKCANIVIPPTFVPLVAATQTSDRTKEGAKNGQGLDPNTFIQASNFAFKR